ncbi:N-acetylornithine carbamoyltransferase [bacterium]|nr:N-acetylornithine carbamoyltransferase [bacterium]
MQNWISFKDHSANALQALVARAIEIKAGSEVDSLRGKILGMMFFNSSLRTRSSFEALMFRHGGHAMTLTPGQDTWNFEHREGILMDADKAEHLKEAVRVLSRYVDALGVRSFAKLESLVDDLSEPVISAFCMYSEKPIVNLESAAEHPCQALADMQTLAEKFKNTGGPKGKKFVLRWLPHLRGLPMAVPHSALLAAANHGMDITIVAPQGYELAADYLALANQRVEQTGGSLSVSNDKSQTLQADVVYGKSWGASIFYGKPDDQKLSLAEHRSWRLELGDLNPQTLFMHCLPLRRNLKVTDAVIDSKNSIIIDQAENRYWAQTAIMEAIFKQ